MSKALISGIISILVSIIPFFCLAQSKVLLGIDVLIRDDFRILQGKRVGLVANSSSRSSTQKMTVEYFVNNPNFTFTAIFTPEHGFFTTIPAGMSVPDDSIYGVPLFSLYGSNRKPTPYQLSMVDIIVFDLQDIGVRSYTYISTLFKVMEACAEFDIPLVVLDRPNPLGGNLVDGNVTDSDKISFVSIIPVPYLHGCTIGEIALMVNGEGWLKSNGSAKRCN
ncbi:MAG: exo-beta-N-acetylmuramidase NamZ domain-containing protein, partial [Candidatus Kapaibacteriota bacterium]